ncbi:hypothetical protein CMO91_01505 [Candidatus Woesearchaeota archaeon]|nr:hypothetical protein [Candidatus Woesearchaeota archaeon]
MHALSYRSPLVSIYAHGMPKDERWSMDDHVRLMCEGTVRHVAPQLIQPGFRRTFVIVDSHIPLLHARANRINVLQMMQGSLDDLEMGVNVEPRGAVWGTYENAKRALVQTDPALRFMPEQIRTTIPLHPDTIITPQLLSTIARAAGQEPEPRENMLAMFRFGLRNPASYPIDASQEDRRYPE